MGKYCEKDNDDKIRKVKIMRLLLVLFLWQLSFISYASDMLTSRAKGPELEMLPEHCQVRFKYGISSREYSKWKEILGQDFLHVHHYCDGLTFLIRARKRDEYQKFYLGSAESNFKYTLKNLINPKYILLPEIYYQLGIVMKEKGEVDKAISYANKSIQAKKDYLKPYLLLFDTYIKLNDLENAEKTILMAKGLFPRSRAIKRRLKKLAILKDLENTIKKK